MPFLWTEGRFIMNRLEVPTLREITAERRKTNLLMKSGVPGDSFEVAGEFGGVGEVVGMRDFL